MKRLNKNGIGVCLLSLSCLLVCAARLHSQQSGTAAIQATTPERVGTEPWWPTKSTVALEAFAGSSSCSGCHAEAVAGRLITPMQRAAEHASEARFLKVKPLINFSSPPFSYSLTANAAGIMYSVSAKEQRLSHNLDWVMGAGELGRTFLYQMDGHWFQSRISAYAGPAALDLTTGLSRNSSADLIAALGERLSPEDARRCFSCHTVHSTTVTGFNPLHAEPGIGCEACHGPARKHVSAMREPAMHSAKDAQESDTDIFDPAKLSPSDSIDFCGSCHRTFADVVLSAGQSTGTAVVRFQPYRLEESRCWRETLDARMTCVACHNPHKPLNRDATSYDKNCLQCHSATSGEHAQHAGNLCPKAKSQCVACHMPKVFIASMHGTFTDHFIRIVRPDEGFPQ